MKKNICFLALLLCAATSCKKHIDKDDAKDIIVMAQNYPLTVDYEITKSFTKDHHTDGNGVTINLNANDFDEKQRMIELFKQNKLIELAETPQREETTAFLLGTTVRTWTAVKVSLTEEGKKYLLKETDNGFKVKLWETTLGRIVKIEEMEQQKEAKVDYSVVNNNITPFGEQFKNKDNADLKSKYFILIDGGWQLKL